MRGEDIVFDIEINENNYMSKDFFRDSGTIMFLCPWNFQNVFESLF